MELQKQLGLPLAYKHSIDTLYRPQLLITNYDWSWNCGAEFRSRSARAYDDQIDVDRWREDANHAKRSMESTGSYSGVGPKNSFKLRVWRSSVMSFWKRNNSHQRVWLSNAARTSHCLTSTIRGGYIHKTLSALKSSH